MSMNSKQKLSLKTQVIDRFTIVLILVMVALAVFTFFFIFQQTQSIVMDFSDEGLTTFTALSASQINGDSLAGLQPGDDNSARYLALRSELLTLRDTSPSIANIYALRLENGSLYYIASMDSTGSSGSGNGGPIGKVFENPTSAMFHGYIGTSIEPELITNEKGTFRSAYAPIRDSEGNVVGILGADLSLSSITSQLNYIRYSFLFVLVMLVVVATVGTYITVAVREKSIREAHERVAAHEREEYLKTLMSSIQAGFFVVDTTEGKIVDVNDTAMRMIASEKSEIVGKPLSGFLSVPPKNPDAESGSSVASDESDRILLVKSGTAIPVLYHETPISINHRPSSLVSFVDIRDRKNMEEKNARLIHELEYTNNELKDFAYIVSHDLKAPLRAIGSLSQWIYADYKDKFDADGKAQLDLLMNRVNRMQNLIEGILEYSRAGRMMEEMVRVDLSTTVTEVIDSLSPAENIRINIDDPLPTVICEKTRIRQVFANLIGNAIKYMDKPQGDIHVGCRQENGFWKFSVRDNGPGIEEKYYEKVFQIFQTLKPRDQFESTGIGLTIVKKIIEMYGGKIWIESKVGEGSTFYFTLPVTPKDKEI